MLPLSIKGMRKLALGGPLTDPIDGVERPPFTGSGLSGITMRTSPPIPRTGTMARTDAIGLPGFGGSGLSDITARTAPGIPMPAAPGTKGGTTAKGFDMKRVSDIASNMEPFMSNIANTFRKPPMPKRGTPNPYVTLQNINLQEERNAVERNTNASNRATERNLDANTAEAVKQFNRGTEFDRLTSINDRQNQANIGIANQQAMLDGNTAVGNNAKVDEYNDAVTARGVAIQREQSANAANAGDKLATMKNEKEKGRVEMEKAKVLRSVYEKSGVLKRDNAIGTQWKAAGIPDPFGEDYKWLETKKENGGLMTKVPGRKLYASGGVMDPGPKH